MISAILPKSNPEPSGQGAQAFDRKSKVNLIDVTDGVNWLEEAARKQSLELSSLARKTGTPLERPPLWSNIRRKVKKNAGGFTDIDEVIDEVTEKIIEAAQSDPFYKKLFR